MMRGVILGGLVVFVAGSSQAAEIVRLDFEQSDTVADFPQVLTTRGEAAIVAAGGDRAGHCLRLANAKPATACGMRLTGIRLERNLVLVLDYRAHVEPGCEGAYLGVAAEIGGTQVLWTSAPFSSQWRTAAIPLAGLMAKANAADVAPGTELSAIRIYARVKEKTAVKGETKARMELWIDNLRVKTERYLAGPMAERESYANPPLLIWARGQGPTRLEYSRDPDFAAGVTKSVEVAGNFHTPPAAWEPGVWYWRASRCARLADHWVGGERLTVPAEAHRFQTAAIPIQDIGRRPRPRLLRLAQVDQAPVCADRTKALVKSARKIYQRGVPEHPGPHTPGDPRWPTWIDWYGKVAGGITGATGRRLQTIAQYAMLTGDA